MNARTNRTGVTARLVIGTLCVVFLIPAMIMFGALFSYQKLSQAQSIAERANAEAERARAIAEIKAAEEAAQNEFGVPPAAENLAPGEARFGYRPVFETAYESQTRVVSRPVVDPDTGETRMVQETVEVKVPVTTTKYVPVGFPPHGPKVMKMVEELWGMDDDDEHRQAKIDELKVALSEEFQQQFEQQGKEIEQTEKRLEKLKETHKLRETKKDEIVQRRADQLTGHPDILQWNPMPSTFSHNPVTRPAPQLRSRAVSSAEHTDPLPTPTTGVPGSRGTIPSAPMIGRSRPDIPSSQVDILFPARVAPSQGSDNPASSSEVFALARQLSSDALAASALQAEQERLDKLYQKNAITESEIQQQRVKLERAKRQAALSRAQWEAMSDRLKRDVQFAEKQYQRTLQQISDARDILRSGRGSRNELLEAEGSMEKARKSLEESQARQEQFAAAEKLIGDTGTDPDTESNVDKKGSTPSAGP